MGILLYVPDQYIEDFQVSTQVNDIFWKDVMPLLTQTLTDTEKQVAIQSIATLKGGLYMAFTSLPD